MLNRLHWSLPGGSGRSITGRRVPGTGIRDFRSADTWILHVDIAVVQVLNCWENWGPGLDRGPSHPPITADRRAISSPSRGI